MSDYSKTTNFTAKDALTTGDPNKVVAGTEIDTELSAVETAVATKADKASPTFTGTVVLPTVQIQDTSADHQYVVGVSELAADRTITLPLLTGNDTFVFADFAATFQNKTIDLSVNTVSGTAAEFDTACSDDTFLFTSDLIDDDTFATATATNVPSAESVKAYADSVAGGGGDALTTDPLSQFAATTSLQLKGVINDETGSGSLVFATSPTLVTPALGTPASGVLTNCTGTAAGLTAGNVTTNADLTGEVTSSGNAATVDSTAISNKTLVTAVGTDHVLIVDATDGALKKALISDFASAGGDMAAATYDAAAIAEQLVGLTATQTLTNKTLTNPVLTQPTLTLTQSTTPTPTAEGVIEWDTDGNAIVVGDGVGGNHRFIAAEDISGDITMADTGVASIASNIIDNDNINASAAIAATKIHDGTVSNTEFGYLNGVTSAIQTQLDSKQSSDGDLTTIAALAKTDGNFIVGNGSNWVAESGATARTSLGAQQDLSAASVTNVTAASDDELLLKDTSDSNNLKSATVSDLLATAGSKVLLNTSAITASNSDSIEFNNTYFDGTYDIYEIAFYNVVPATDAVGLYLRTSTDNGVSFDAGATDYWTWTDNGQVNDDHINIVSTGLGSAAGENGCSGYIRIYKPSAAALTQILGARVYVSSDGKTVAGDANSTETGIGGARHATADVDAVQFIMSSGNIESGSFAIYGIKTS